MEFVDSHPMACAWAGRALTTLVTLALIAAAAQMLFHDRQRRRNLRHGLCRQRCDSLGDHYLYLCDPVRHSTDRGSRGDSCDWLSRRGDLHHFRPGAIASPPQIISLVLGLMTWGGLYLWNAHVRSLLAFVI
jgi:hypothetical protein